MIPGHDLAAFFLYAGISTSTLASLSPWCLRMRVREDVRPLPAAIDHLGLGAIHEWPSDCLTNTATRCISLLQFVNILGGSCTAGSRP